MDTLNILGFISDIYFASTIYLVSKYTFLISSALKSYEESRRILTKRPDCLPTFLKLIPRTGYQEYAYKVPSKENEL